MTALIETVFEHKTCDENTTAFCHTIFYLICHILFHRLPVVGWKCSSVMLTVDKINLCTFFDWQFDSSSPSNKVDFQCGCSAGAHLNEKRPWHWQNHKAKSSHNWCNDKGPTQCLKIPIWLPVFFSFLVEPAPTFHQFFGCVVCNKKCTQTTALVQKLIESQSLSETQTKTDAMILFPQLALDGWHSVCFKFGHTPQTMSYQSAYFFDVLKTHNVWVHCHHCGLLGCHQTKLDKVYVFINHAWRFFSRLRPFQRHIPWHLIWKQMCMHVCHVMDASKFETIYYSTSLLRMVSKNQAAFFYIITISFPFAFS